MLSLRSDQCLTESICYRFIFLTFSLPQGNKVRACRTDTRQREAPELLRHIKFRLTRRNQFIPTAQ